MPQVLKNLSLPAFAFIEDAQPNGELEGRNVILHVRSSSVIEMLKKETLITLNGDSITYDFDYINPWGCVEHYVAVLHYCTTFDSKCDTEIILEKIMKPAADWFTSYLEWEDSNIIKENKDMKHNGKFAIAKDNNDNMFIVRNKEPYFTIKTGKNTDLNKLARSLKSCAEYLIKIVGYGRE